MKDIIYGLSNEDYHNGEGYRDYISSTSLKHYQKSPRFFKFMQDNPQPQTEAMRFGSLFHDLMECMAKANGDWDLGFRWWDDKYVLVKPLVNPKTNLPYGTTTQAYKKYMDELREKHPTRELIDTESYDILCAMSRALVNSDSSTSEQVRKLLKWGKPEVSVFYETEDGIKLKVRPDLLTPKKIVDWKTFAGDDLTEESINRVILKYGYHISAAQYQYVYHKATGKWVAFYLVFIQKQPPYDCVMVDMAAYGYRYIKEWDMVQTGPGAVEFQRLLDLHTKCIKSGEYPGAETFIPGDKYRILEIEPPRYYANRFMED